MLPPGNDREEERTVTRRVFAKTITLPKESTDDPLGYYYPEKGLTAWFKAHGSIRVDPLEIIPVDPAGIMSECLEREADAHKDHPHTRFSVIRHGQCTYIVQAKRLNGRKLLFGKMIHDGTGFIEMTHWAKLTGGHPMALIRKAGIDPDQL